MIISRTPFRVSFFGGGTDYSQWIEEHGGSILATTIDKYVYLSCRYLPPFFKHKFRAIYSKIENTQSISEISHPAIREVLNFLQVKRGLEVHHDGDLPARSGMGSSSSFTVGLLHAVHALQGVMPKKEELARDAITVEQDLIGETVGSQDQVMSAYGGLNHVLFHRGGGFSVQPITISNDRITELNDHLMLFYTGILRTASDIAESYIGDIGNKRRQLRVMKDLVEEGISVLCRRGDLNAFGELLHESWQAKKTLGAKISNCEIDEIYDAARSAGAIGGKLMGAGGGGFMLLFVPPEQQPSVRERLSDLIYVPFKFERSGSQIIFFDHEQDYGELETERSRQILRPFREEARGPRVVVQRASPAAVKPGN